MYMQPTEENYFHDANYSKNVDSIIPTAELLVNFCGNGVRAKKSCFVYAEKMEFKGLIQLRLIEKSDQRRMYITTVDSASFHELKQDQSLHVTFSGFIENLVRILRDCHAGKLEINLAQMPAQSASSRLNEEAIGFGASSSEFQLQFMEMRSFKNLIHLCLPSRLAPLNVVLFYMNSILDTMQKKLILHENTTQQLQHEVDAHLRRIDQLNAENIEAARTLKLRHADEMKQMQDSLCKAAEQRQSDNERSRKTISTLQAQVDKLSTDKASLQTEKQLENKRNETLNVELVSIRATMTNTRDQNEKLHAEIASIKNVERKNEMHLVETRKHIGELQEKIKKHDRAKADISAELEAEKKISQTKRQALEMATEEISKANEIIRRQSLELVKLKKTITWRTEVALQQEKAINEKDNVVKLCNEEIRYQRQTIESLRLEIPQQLEAMRKFANSLELKYAEQIKILKEKLKPSIGKENQSTNIGSSKSCNRGRK